MATYRYDVIPGASLNFLVTVVDALGAAVDLAGATVEGTVTAGTYSAAVDATSTVDGWTVTVGAPITVALAGLQAKLRVWVTPAASVETSAIEATINVKP